MILDHRTPYILKSSQVRNFYLTYIIADFCPGHGALQAQSESVKHFADYPVTSVPLEFSEVLSKNQ